MVEKLKTKYAKETAVTTQGVREIGNMRLQPMDEGFIETEGMTKKEARKKAKSSEKMAKRLRGLV